MIKVVMDGNLPGGLGGKKSQAVLGISIAVITVFRQPANAGADYLIKFPLVGKLVDLNILTVFPVCYLHENFPFLIEMIRSLFSGANERVLYVCVWCLNSPQHIVRQNFSPF
jgi:hypothetical protein